MYRILLVEDSEDSKNLVTKCLGSAYELTWAASLESAHRNLEGEPFDMVLLDVSLPDGDGFRFFSALLNENNHKNTPVIFLTSKDGVSDKVLGFSLGAEDYIVKPFQGAELKARVEMRLKKVKSRQNEPQIITKGKLEINLGAQRAFMLEGTKKEDLQLTSSEFRVLTLLATNEEQVYTRDHLMDKVWGNDTYVTDRSVDTHIYSLRKKLGELAGYIQAIYGEGYRFSLNLAAPAMSKQARPGKRSRRGA